MWSNCWEGYGDGEMKERLDKCLSNAEWMQKFDEASCTYVENEAPNLFILILDTNLDRQKRRMRFYFDQ